jgi:hypothetical protein
MPKQFHVDLAMNASAYASAYTTAHCGKPGWP